MRTNHRFGRRSLALITLGAIAASAHAQVDLSQFMPLAGTRQAWKNPDLGPEGHTIDIHDGAGGTRRLHVTFRTEQGVQRYWMEMRVSSRGLESRGASDYPDLILPRSWTRSATWKRRYYGISDSSNILWWFEWTCQIARTGTREIAAAKRTVVTVNCSELHPYDVRGTLEYEVASGLGIISHREKWLSGDGSTRSSQTVTFASESPQPPPADGAPGNVDTRSTEDRQFSDFMAACGRDDVESLRKMLDSGGARFLERMNEETGETPLVRAAALGHSAVVALLLSKGASPDGMSRRKVTPLLQAAFEGDAESVRVLLEHEANPSYVEPEFQESPVYIAVAERHRKVVELLMAAGADMNTRSEGGAGILKLADRNGWQDLVPTMKARGATE